MNIKLFVMIFFIIFPDLLFAQSPTLRCPNASEIAVTTQKQLYGTFIQWKANINGIPYSNDNAQSAGPLQLISVRLFGQAVNCVYSANQGPAISQVSHVTQVSMTNFGDVGKQSHYVNGEKNVCPFGGGYCCEVSASDDCGFVFDN